MKRSILPVAILILVFAFPALAQTRYVPASQQTSDASDTTDALPPQPQPAMTPERTAELRGDILMARKMYPEAIEDYKAILKSEPKNAVVLNKIGVAYEIFGSNRDAEKYFKKAMKADKTYASAYNNVGTVEYAKHHYGSAIKWYKKTLKLRTDMATVYSNMGYAYFDEKKYPEAVGSFRQAILLDPMILQEHGNGGSVVQQRGETDPGLFYYFVARTYAMMGNAAQAAHYLKISRDDGYKKFTDAKKDAAFAKVIKDPAVQAVFAPVPELANSPRNVQRD